MICVVIPYFQREPGILAKALASIATQRDCPLPVHVVVVDDASPMPASGEVAAAGALPFTFDVIRQANGGPGAARNTGLSRAPAGTKYIALLDSDDSWSPDHLQRAVAALGAGYQFYFADHYQLGQSVGAFQRAGRIVAADHTPLPLSSALPLEGLYAYRGDMLDQIIRGNVIGTSTVVYDRAAFAANRFRVDLTTAGEDYLFWMEIARSGARFCFSTAVEATYGKGVNVYAGATWGSEQQLLRIQHELSFRKMVFRQFRLNASQNALVREQVATLRSAFAASLLHRMARLQRTSVGLLLDQLRVDPVTFAQLPASAWSIVRDRTG
jgi:succinoglycan biosynthesis protein ExoW